MTTSTIFCLGSSYGNSMSTNQLFSLNFALGRKISNQSESRKKFNSDIRVFKECTIWNMRDRIYLNQVASKFQVLA